MEFDPPEKANNEWGGLLVNGGGALGNSADPIDNMDGARAILRQNLVRIQGEEATARAMAWALSPPGTPYGGIEGVSAGPRSGTAPDPDQSIPRLRGGDACG